MQRPIAARLNFTQPPDAHWILTNLVVPVSGSPGARVFFLNDTTVNPDSTVIRDSGTFEVTDRGNFPYGFDVEAP